MALKLPVINRLMVLTSATIWGISGVLIHYMVTNDLPAVRIAYYANLSGVLLIGGGLLVFARHRLKVGRRLPKLLLLGFIGSGASFVCYSSAIALTGVSLATLLTSIQPAWTTLLAARFLGEAIGKRRVVAVAAAFIGSALVVRVYDPDAIQANLIGILFGLASGLTYAMYNVFGKLVLTRDHPLTVTAFGFMGGSLLLLPFQSVPFPTAVTLGAAPWLAIYVVLAVMIGPIMFNAGLRSLPAGVVSLLGTWELIVAVALGVLLLGESLDLPQAIGALLVGGSMLTLRSDASAPPSEPVPPLPVELPGSKAGSLARPT